MFDRFTEPAHRAMFVTRHNAFLDGCASIESLHLLHALLDGKDSSVPSLLESLGIAVDRIRTLLPPIPATPRIPGDPVTREIPFSGAFKAMLGVAVEEADALGHAQIGTGHLLLALLREESLGSPAPLSGIRLESVRNALSERLPEPPAAPRHRKTRRRLYISKRAAAIIVTVLALMLAVTIGFLLTR